MSNHAGLNSDFSHLEKPQELLDQILQHRRSIKSVTGELTPEQAEAMYMEQRRRVIDFNFDHGFYANGKQGPEDARPSKLFMSHLSKTKQPETIMSYVNTTTNTSLPILKMELEHLKAVLNQPATLSTSLNGFITRVSMVVLNTPIFNGSVGQVYGTYGQWDQTASMYPNPSNVSNIGKTALSLEIAEIEKVLESTTNFEQIKQYTSYFISRLSLIYRSYFDQAQQPFVNPGSLAGVYPNNPNYYGQPMQPQQEYSFVPEHPYSQQQNYQPQRPLSFEMTTLIDVFKISLENELKEAGVNGTVTRSTEPVNQESARLIVVGFDKNEEDVRKVICDAINGSTVSIHFNCWIIALSEDTLNIIFQEKE